MSRRSWLAAICLVGALCAPAHAGERVMAEFFDASEGRNQRTPEVLPHVPLKAIVAEFLDPLDVGLGKSLSYLVWRETLTAISDQAGAGVILAEAPPGERLVDMLERDYHLAAERIARHQHGRMALWGAVEPEGDALIIEPYLSIQDVKGDSALRLALEGKVVTGPRRSAQAERQPLISAAILRGELRQVGAGEPGRNAQRMLDLDNPALDWTALARGSGVEAARATDCETLVAHMKAALSRRGPFLIEAVI